MAYTTTTTITLYLACTLAVLLSLVTISESRPQNFDLVKTIAGNTNSNWKNDDEYIFKWDGAFSLGTPEHSKCPMVLQPEHGRFVCSVGTVLERSMCLVECKNGFEQDRPPVVYICENGKWLDLTRKPISTPEPQCVPKPVAAREFAE